MKLVFLTTGLDGPSLLHVNEPLGDRFYESAPFGIGLVVLDGLNGGYPSAPARKERRPVGLVKLADDAARIDLQIGQGNDIPGKLFIGLQGTS
jgi:hypothetical protein